LIPPTVRDGVQGFREAVFEDASINVAGFHAVCGGTGIAAVKGGSLRAIEVSRSFDFVCGQSRSRRTTRKGSQQ